MYHLLNPSWLKVICQLFFINLAIVFSGPSPGMERLSLSGLGESLWRWSPFKTTLPSGKLLHNYGKIHHF